MTATTTRALLYFLLAILIATAGSVVPIEAADGALDPTFDTDGKVITDFLVQITPDLSVSSTDGASAVAVQADGKVVAAGFTLDADANEILGLARYNPDGGLDGSFGTGGKVAAGFFRMVSFPKAADLAIQADGKIVVVGATWGTPFTYDFGIARFNPNGTPDPSFGGTGFVVTSLGGSASANAVAIQKDGKIVVAGRAGSDFAVVRYNADGTLDTSAFGGGTGIVTTDFFGESDFANGVAIQGDGKIVAVGAAVQQVSGFDFRWLFAVARYNTDGTPDTGFGGGGTGKAALDFAPSNPFEHWNQANAVAIQPADQKIVVAGWTFVNSFAVATGYDFALARFNTDGTLDTSFGGGGTGMVTSDLPSGASPGFDQAYGLALQADGKIVLGGARADLSNVELHVDFAVARYNTDGTLDTSFGGGVGWVTTSFLGQDIALGVAIQADCKIVAAGYTWGVQSTPDGEVFTNDFDFALARYDGGACSVVVASRCPLSQGYWKNHASSWPVSSLTLGGQSYTKAELLALLGTSSQTDASLILARQLIAAKLDVANGSDPAPISATIAQADSLLAGYAGKLPYNVKPSSSAGQSMTADASVLESYNKALLTPGCAP